MEKIDTQIFVNNKRWIQDWSHSSYYRGVTEEKGPLCSQGQESKELKTEDEQARYNNVTLEVWSESTVHTGVEEAVGLTDMNVHAKFSPFLRF